MFARVSVLIGVVALTLSICGVFAVSVHSVAERWREFGIRMALGAPTHAVRASVLLRSTVLAVPGLTTGLAAYLWASRVIESRLFGISALDPLTLGGACAVLLIAALVAAWLPARRATRVDPTIALRCD
jgi:ABC-type antimicrobial peptide transport system permease subunit